MHVFYVYIYMYVNTKCIHIQIPKSEYLLTIKLILLITIYVKTIYIYKKRGSKYVKNVNEILPGRTADDHFHFCIFLYFSKVQGFLFGFGFLEKMVDLHALHPRELLESH